MNRRVVRLFSVGALLTGLLSACVPAPLRAQPNAQVQVQTALTPAPVQAVTGEGGLYRSPGPSALQLRTDRPAFVTAVLVPQSGGAQVFPVGAVAADTSVAVTLPGTRGFTQVFTVTSLQPLNLGAAAGARSLDEVARVVQQAAAPLPTGSYTVATTVYRVVSFGSVAVNASPSGSEVRVDGRRVGNTPLTLRDVPEGRVTVEVSRDGYDSVSQSVTVRPDATTQVSASLNRETGGLRVDSDVPARVLIEGQGAGGTPLRVRVRPGVINVNVVPLDPAARTETLLVRVNAHEDTSIVCRAAPEFTCSVR
ncbi:PEGA domain-containing protein [Deinococcus marmoris]|uniref:S-layer protein n=1 Tax=Deinococcus marmoris TaxID=249408 RepID=A0A1U7NV48_9DEIO|nr:PEGA domain-containing protein [Deinococcus marmoris]OLV16794.1 S-layer protein [Deinococcus marmoris]